MRAASPDPANFSVDPGDCAKVLVPFGGGK
jgi:hypothetical protein